MNLFVSHGNTKIGKVLNLSLPPLLSCSANPPCAHDCYALQAYRMYPNVRDEWDSNLMLWATNRQKFEEQLHAILQFERPKRFRWHVGGDIPDAGYLMMMERTGQAFPKIKFLAFTRRPVKFTFAENLTVIRSHWLEDFQYDEEQPHAYVSKDGFFDQPPSWDNHHIHVQRQCPGKCGPCGYTCWDMKPGDIVHFKHRKPGRSSHAKRTES